MRADLSKNGAATINALKTLLFRSHSWVNKWAVNLGTLPYYRFFRQNTLLPILNIVEAKRRGVSHRELVRLLTNWRQRKIDELRFVQAASTLLAAAVIGCFSWATVVNEYWLGPAFWYSSLVLSILAILLSSSQAFVFNSLSEPTVEDYHDYLKLIITTSNEAPSGNEEFSVRNEPQLSINTTFVPRWKMMFTWQCPMMFMAYSVCFFLGGLTIYVCTPLFNGEISTNGGKTGAFFLAVTALAGSAFIYCSFWASKFIDFDRTVQHAEDTSFDIPKSGSMALSPRFATSSKSMDTMDHGRR